MTQIGLDLTEGKRRKAEGQEQVKAREDYGWLDQARRVARGLALAHGNVTSDDVLARVGRPVGVHHNLIGNIFSVGFVRIGFTQTKRPEGHSRMIGVWTITE